MCVYDVINVQVVFFKISRTLFIKIHKYHIPVYMRTVTENNVRHVAM